MFEYSYTSDCIVVEGCKFKISNASLLFGLQAQTKVLPAVCPSGSISHALSNWRVSLSQAITTTIFPMQDCPALLESWSNTFTSQPQALRHSIRMLHLAVQHLLHDPVTLMMLLIYQQPISIFSTLAVFPSTFHTLLPAPYFSCVTACLSFFVASISSLTSQATRTKLTSISGRNWNGAAR